MVNKSESNLSILLIICVQEVCNSCFSILTVYANLTKHLFCFICTLTWQNKRHLSSLFMALFDRVYTVWMCKCLNGHSSVNIDPITRIVSNSQFLAAYISLRRMCSDVLFDHEISGEQGKVIQQHSVFCSEIS